MRPLHATLLALALVSGAFVSACGDDDARNDVCRLDPEDCPGGYAGTLYITLCRFYETCCYQIASSDVNVTHR